MSSIKCPQCNLTNWATATNCKRCGGFLLSDGDNLAAPQNFVAGHDAFAADQQTANDQNEAPGWTPPAERRTDSETSAQYQNYEQADHQHYRTPHHAYYKPASLKTGLALASMILGIAGFVTSIFLIGVLIAPVGLILGIVALVKANREPHVYGGRGYAIAGVATSSVIVLFIPIIAAIAIPNFLVARRAANEGSAIATMRRISSAEANYMRSSDGKCGDVKALIATKLLDVSLAEGEQNGYRFLVVNLPYGGCEILATPVSTSYGNRSFYYSTEDSVLRGGPKKGAPADKNDFPIGGGEMPKAAQKPNEF